MSQAHNTVDEAGSQYWKTDCQWNSTITAGKCVPSDAEPKYALIDCSKSKHCTHQFITRANPKSTHLIVDSPCGNASMRRYQEWSHASAHTMSGDEDWVGCEQKPPTSMRRLTNLTIPLGTLDTAGLNTECQVWQGCWQRKGKMWVGPRFKV